MAEPSSSEPLPSREPGLPGSDEEAAQAAQEEEGSMFKNNQFFLQQLQKHIE